MTELEFLETLFLILIISGLFFWMVYVSVSTSAHKSEIKRLQDEHYRLDNKMYDIKASIRKLKND